MCIYTQDMQECYTEKPVFGEKRNNPGLQERYKIFCLGSKRVDSKPAHSPFLFSSLLAVLW